MDYGITWSEFRPVASSLEKKVENAQLILRQAYTASHTSKKKDTMFRSRIHGRLLENYERRICTELCGRRANGTERCFAMAAQKKCCASMGRGYATTTTGTSSRISQSAAKAVNKPPPGSASSTRISGTSSTMTAATAVAAEGSSSATALRTAEARESALRAARMRRQAQKQDREEEAAKKREEEREYRKKYNTAARKWVSSIIALPIFLVTSYYLFDRREFLLPCCWNGIGREEWFILTLWDSGVGEAAEEFGKDTGGEGVRVCDGVFECF